MSRGNLRVWADEARRGCYHFRRCQEDRLIERVFVPGQTGHTSRLRRGWWALAALYVSALADLGVGLLDHGAALVVAMALVAAVAWALNESRLHRIQTALQPLRVPIGLLLLAGLFGYGLIMRPQFLYAHVGLALAATACLIALTLFSDDTPLAWPWRWTAAAAAVVVVATGLRIYSLTTVPNVDLADEPWNLSWSVTYLHTGHVSEIGMAGVPGDPTYYTTEYVPRWALLVAGWLRLVGIGLWQGRLFSLVMTFPLIAITALAARNLYGKAGGWLTAAVMFASGFTVLAFRLRHDIGLALALALSIWLFSEAIKRDRLGLHFLAGLMIGFGAFAHYYALAFGPLALVALYLPRFLADWRLGRRVLERGAWLYALGLFLGLGVVGVVQVAPDVATFFSNRAPRHPSDVTQFFDILFGYLGTLVQVSWYEALLIGLALLVVPWRRHVFDLSLLIFAVFGHIALAILTNMIKDHYLVALAPIYGLLVGRLLGELFAPRAGTLGRLGLVMSLCVLMPSLGQTLKTPVRAVIARQPMIEAAPVAATWVLDHVTPDHRVLAENIYYTWLYDYPFLATNVIDVMTPNKLSVYPTLGDFWLSLKPDVVILDPNLTSFGNLRPLLDEAFMRAHGFTLVAQFQGRSQPVLIYARERSSP